MSKSLNEQVYEALDLLYDQSFVKSQLTADPSRGPMDVQAFIDGKERCFRALDKTRIKAKKNIIITSWYLGTLQSSHIFYQCFGDLIAQGFNIYFPKDGKLIKIPDRDSIGMLALYTPITTQAARTLAAKQQLSNEHTDIFNTKRFVEFFSSLKSQGIEPYAPQLDGERYPRLPDWDLKILHNIEALIEDQDELFFELGFSDRVLSKKIQQHIHSISVGNITDKNIDLLYGLAHHLKEARLLNTKISSQQLAIFLDKAHQLESLELRFEKGLKNPPTEFSPPHCPHLTTIYAKDSIINALQLFSLIAGAPHLEKITLQNITLQHDIPFNLLPDQLRNLRFITANDSLSTKQLAPLLKAAPNLESLQFVSTSLWDMQAFDHTPLMLLPKSLPQLKRLRLHCTANLISAAQLRELILAAPGLEDIQISEHTLGESSALSALSKDDLRHLKSFTARNTSLSPEQVLIFLRAPLLETADISDYQPLVNILKQLKPGELSHIRDFKIPRSLTATDLGAMLNATPNLETLNLMGMKNLGQGSFSLPKDSLKKLATIYTSGTITTSQMASILNASPNLQTLNLDSTTLIGTTDLGLKEGQLPYLENISVDSSTITAQQVESLLKSAPLLKKLTINQCTTLGDKPFYLRPQSRPFLTELNAMGSSINAQQLENLINSAPNLTTLKLQNCTNLGKGPLSLLPGQLAQLHYLDLSGSSITASQLQSLILAAPNLKSIDLNACECLNFLPLTLPEEQLPHLEEIRASGSSITPQQFLNLVHAAPQLKTAHIGKTELLPYNPFMLNEIMLKDIKKVPADQLKEAILALAKAKFRATSITTSSAPSTFKGTEAAASFAPPLSMMANLSIDGHLKNDPNKTFQTSLLFKGHSINPKTQSYHLNASTWTHPGQFIKYSPISASLEPIPFPTIRSPISILQDFNNNPAFKTADHYYGQVELGPLSPNTWYQLPALSTHDSLQSIATNFSNHEIQHDKESGYYYLRVTKPVANATISYLIQSTPDTPRNVQRTNPIDLELIKHLQFKQDGTLENNSAFESFSTLSKKDKINALFAYCYFDQPSANDIKGSPTDILNQLIKLRAGACRHRSMLFAALAKAFDLNAALIQNGCHAFISILDENNQRISIDLGGAPAAVNEQAMAPLPAPQQEPTPAPIEPEITPAPRAPIEEPIAPLPNPPIHEPLVIESHNPFQTWDSLPLKSDNFSSLADELLTSELDISRRLLIMRDKSAIEGLHEAVIGPNKSTFFTQNLDEMSTKTLKASDGPYEIIDNPLASFLKEAQTHPEKQMTWFINWSNPKAEHVGLNSILDDVGRRLNHIELPSNLHLVVTIDTASAALMGEDFYSRFDVISQAPELNGGSTIKPITEPTVSPEPKDAMITTGDDWQTVLIGTYHIDGTSIKFEPGALINAIQHPDKHLKIHNAPWDNAAFRGFITELQQRKQITINGQTYPLPEGFTLEFVRPLFQYPAAPESISKPEPSLYERMTHFVSKIPAFFRWLFSGMPQTNVTAMTTETQEKKRNPIIVNTATYAYLFPHQYVTQTSGIGLAKGFLEPNSPLTLIVTEQLSEAQWYKIWQTCNQNHIDLTLQCTPDIAPPEGLKHLLTQTGPLTPNASIALIISNDLDAASESYQGGLSIPIGPDTEFESLFFHVHRAGDQFSAHETQLLKALREGHAVTFKGEFSKALASRLQTLFKDPPTLYINGENIPIQGPMTMLTKDKTPFLALTHQTFSYEPENDFKKLKEPLQTELRTLYETLEITPQHRHFQDLPTDETDLETWFTSLKKSLVLSAGYSTHPALATSPDEVLNYLNTHPFVFLTSQTGAGKSYFVERLLREEGRAHGRDISIHHGLEALKHWAKSGGDAILFLDEANLSAEHFHYFDNLARNEPIIWIDGESYPLSPKHKIIFAGNPKQYEGRFEPDLLKRFPYYLEFKGQSLEKILSPLLESFESRDDLLHLIETYYQKALDAGLNITPRNTQMMCLNAFILKHQPLTEHMPDIVLMQSAILQEIQNLTKDETLTRNLQASIPEPEQASIQEARQAAMPKLRPTDFIWTKSRKKIALSIQTLLNIREQKIAGKVDQDLGINGLVLEGGPGLGKSRLLITLLELNDKETPYTIISTTQPDAMRRELLKAFDEGKIVLIDELNSFPDEQLLNALLSGTNLEGKPPTKPGFCLLATQNPIDFQGRQALSKALSNRLLTLNLEHYAPDELEDILEHKFKLSKTEANQLISEYNGSLNYAKQQNLFPPPNPRKLFKEAEKKSKNIDPPPPTNPKSS